MATPVVMPRQGQSVETCILGQWYKKPGEAIVEGDLLFSYETDKAAFEEEAKASGILLAVFFNQGDEVPVLTNIGVIGKEGEPVEEFSPKTKPLPVSEIKFPDGKIAIAAPTIFPETESNGKIKISPLARNMAKSMTVNLKNIRGSGPGGRIIASDIKNAPQGGQQDEEETPSLTTKGDDYEIRPLTNIRKLIAKAMFHSLQSSAQLTHHMSADVRKVLAFREEVKAALKKKELTVNIPLNAIICWCLIRALKKHPDINAHFLGDSIKTFTKVHLGFAVDTRSGLMVPTVKNADDLSLVELSSQMDELRRACMRRNINPDLLVNEAASFSVSNLEAYEVEMFSPVINLPQVAILGINSVLLRPVETKSGEIEFAPFVGLSLTYDHRAIDGGPATLFLRTVKQEIEKFDQIISDCK